MSTRETTSTGTQTSVAASATAVTLLAANTSRLSASIFNDSTVTLYVLFNSGASITNYKVQLVGGAYYEFPFPIHTGIVTGIWDSATGSARVSEMT